MRHRDDISDDDLLMQFAATGDRALFSEIFERHWRIVFLRCRGILGSTEAAEEVTQETFVRVFKNAGSFRGGAAVPWLLSIAHNLSINWVRGRARELAPPCEVIPIPERRGDPGEADLLLQVAAVLRRLEVHQRTALKLHYFEGYSYEEIADLTGWEAGSVKSYLQNGRRQFAKWWNDGVRRDRA